MQKNNLKINKRFVRFTDTTSTDTKKAVKEIVSGSDRPTCIICTTDSMALDCLDQLLSLGMKVPEDISLSGVDNISLSSHQAIQLTTIHYNKQAMAQIAVEKLMELMEDATPRDKDRKFVLQPEIIVRNTTANILT